MPNHLCRHARHIRIGTLNIAKQYNPTGITEIMRDMDMDVFAIQEPPQGSLTSPRTLIHNKLLTYNARIVDSDYCLTIIDALLAPAVVHTHITAQGRCQCITLQTRTAHLTIINIYDVQHNNTNSCIPAVTNAIATISSKFSDISFIFVGDFQA